GTVCGAPTCAAGEAMAEPTCDGSGTCTPGDTTSCDPYTCDGAGAACRTSCQNDSHCVATHFCDPEDNTCQPRLADGEPCDAANECLSGFCPTGNGSVCCDTACDGTCKSCLGMWTGGNDGTCGNVESGADPHNDCLTV